MIRSNLSVLLAERNLRITTVSRETGISRTTLTSLANNANTGVQLETINQLCNYLRTEPDKLLQYLPYEIEFLFEDPIYSYPVLQPTDSIMSSAHTTLTMLITGRNGSVGFELSVRIEQTMAGDRSEVAVAVELEDPSGQNEAATEKNNRQLKDFMQAVPVPFQEDLSRKLFNALNDRLIQELGISEDGFDGANFSWPFARFYMT